MGTLELEPLPLLVGFGEPLLDAADPDVDKDWKPELEKLGEAVEDELIEDIVAKSELGEEPVDVLATEFDEVWKVYWLLLDVSVGFEVSSDTLSDNSEVSDEKTDNPAVRSELRSTLPPWSWRAISSTVGMLVIWAIATDFPSS